MNVLKSNSTTLLKITTILPPIRNHYIKYKPLIQENYPVEYKKPMKTPCYTPQKSGDLGLKIDVSPDDYILHCENSKELEDADEVVKRIFSLKFNPRRETVKVMKDRLTKKIQQHKYDTSSTEVKIGIMTLRINLMQEYISECRNVQEKVRLKELIDKRNKQLKLLRNIDYKLYEWLLEQLNIFYRLPLEDSHEKVTKKGTIRALTDELCQKIIQDKLDAYRAELDKEKKVFFKENLEKLKYIKEQELTLGLTPTVTEEDIVAAIEKMKKYC